MIYPDKITIRFNQTYYIPAGDHLHGFEAGDELTVERKAVRDEHEVSMLQAIIAVQGKKAEVVNG